LYLRVRQRPTTTLVLLLIVTMFALVDTHTIIALTLLIILVVARSVEILAPRIRSLPIVIQARRSSTLWAFFAVLMFGWWAYVSGNLSNLGLLIRWAFQYELWGQSAASLRYLSTVPDSEYLLINLGLLMFVCLTLLGTLTLLTRRETLESLSILSATWIFGFVGLGSIVLGLSGL